MLPPVIFLLAFLSLFVIGFKILFKGFILSEACIKPIFDVIVNTPWHVLLNLNPLIAIDLVELHELQVLSDGPLLFVQVWVHIVIPSLPTLFADSSGQKGSDLLPLFEAIFSHLLLEDHVFFRCPVTLNLLDGTILSVISEKKPPVHTLNFGLFLTKDGLLFGRHVSP